MCARTEATWQVGRWRQRWWQEILADSHWAGGSQCPSPGAGAGRKGGGGGAAAALEKPAKQIRIAEAEHSAAVTEAGGLIGHEYNLHVKEMPVEHDVLMTSCGRETLNLEQAQVQNVSCSALVILVMEASSCTHWQRPHLQLDFFGANWNFGMFDRSFFLRQLDLFWASHAEP